MIGYPYLKRHWCPLSEAYATGDALMTALDQGWSVCGDIIQRSYTLPSKCQTIVYFVTLHRANELRMIAVISTPFVARWCEGRLVRVMVESSPRRVERIAVA